MGKTPNKVLQTLHPNFIFGLFICSYMTKLFCGFLKKSSVPSTAQDVNYVKSGTLRGSTLVMRENMNKLPRVLRKHWTDMVLVGRSTLNPKFYTILYLTWPDLFFTLFNNMKATGPLQQPGIAGSSSKRFAANIGDGVMLPAVLPYLPTGVNLQQFATYLKHFPSPVIDGILRKRPRNAQCH